ncbi:MAG: 50S ribosomal protein L14e [Promethearchaeota archaeon]
MTKNIYDIGRICVKTMGREAGKHCVVVDIIDKNYLLIDGLTIRRRRVNYKHVEPLEDIIDIQKGASHDEVEKAIKKAKLTEKMKKVISIPV